MSPIFLTNSLINNFINLVYNMDCYESQYLLQVQQKIMNIIQGEEQFTEEVIENIKSTIGQAIDSYNCLLMKEDSFKVQLDNIEGQNYFKEYMRLLQNLSNILNSQIIDRTFRKNYSNAYKVLYQEGALGYIPQIFDSAQQGFPFIYVNAERFDFSVQVLACGQTLIEAHYKLIHFLRFFHIQVDENTYETNKQNLYQIKQKLECFDKSWVQYQKKYIRQLIQIENYSKQSIMKIIKVEEELTNFEKDQKLRGKIFLSGTEFDEKRQRLCEKIAKLNSIANIDGKGRDDLSFQVLIAAQNVLARVTDLQSKSVRIVAEKIRQSFENVREVLRFFSQNFEMVDPQLKNNPQLVAALVQYQSSWEKGKRYFLQTKKQNQIVACSTIVEAAREKYVNFKQMLEYSDPSVFWIIPSLIVLRSLEDQDEGLAESFLCQKSIGQKYNQYLKLKSQYLKSRGDHGFQLYNRMEELIVNGGQDSKQFTLMLNKIKELAVSLERIHPIDWNDMLGILLIDQ